MDIQKEEKEVFGLLNICEYGIECRASNSRRK
jgi:hypothetical protein